MAVQIKVVILQANDIQMKRRITEALCQWKDSRNRKPLILLGARQVGKTYILKEFGRTEYKNVVYLNCDDNEEVKKLFFNYDTERIIRNLSAISGESIVPGQTLVILDEIQEVERGLHCLKYFSEKSPEYHIAVAGSLLGIALNNGTSFPVGKVDLLHMHPMDFEEFLMATGKESLLQPLAECDWESVNALHTSYEELLRQYYFVGGMPEAVARYVETNDIWEVRRIQEAILAAYHNDVSKHAVPQQIQRINQVWSSIPSQLARDNKKFIFGAVKKGARAADFEIAIQWLIDAGEIYKVPKITKPAIPLKFYEDPSAFKLFILDCGLLGALSQTPPQQILIDNNVFEEYKGAFSENYVLQQLMTLPQTYIYYYSNANSTAEIDFVVQCQDKVFPIEVKSEENLRAKSLRLFVNDNPQLHGIRFSMAPYKQQDWLTNIPLYAVRSGLTQMVGSSPNK